MTRRTTQSKSEMVNAAIGNKRQERMSLAESRDILYEKFYNNIRLLIATEIISMVELARSLGLKSGARIYELCYGRAIPATEELMIFAKHYNCTIDDLLSNTAKVAWSKPENTHK